MDSANAEDPWTPLNITPTSSTRNSLLGKRRACNTLDRYEWLFLGVVSFTLAVVLSLTLCRIYELPVRTSEFTLAVLVLFNIVVCYIYAYHGVFFEQPNEIGFLVISTVIILIYSALGYHVGEILDTVKFIYICFISPVITVMGFHIAHVYRISGNLVFRTVGGDPFMQIICRRAQLQCVLLLFDAQAIYSCIILVIHAVGLSLMQELLVFILGSFFTLIWLLIGYITIRFESLISVAVFLILCTVQPSYVVWRLVTVNLYESDSQQVSISNVSGIFFLLVHFYLIANTIRVYQNFGKGLKEKIFGVQRPTSQYGSVHEPIQT